MACGIRNFGLWNPEYFQAVDSDSLSVEVGFRIPDSGFRIPIIGGFPHSLELRPSRLSWIPLHGVILNAVNKRTKPVFLRSLCGQ